MRALRASAAPLAAGRHAPRPAVGVEPRRSPSPEGRAPGPPAGCGEGGCGEGGCGRLLPALQQPPPLRYRPETAAPTRGRRLRDGAVMSGRGAAAELRGRWPDGGKGAGEAGTERRGAAERCAHRRRPRQVAGGRDGGSGAAQPARRLPQRWRDPLRSRCASFPWQRSFSPRRGAAPHLRTSCSSCPATSRR